MNTQDYLFALGLRDVELGIRESNILSDSHFVDRMLTGLGLPDVQKLQEWREQQQSIAVVSKNEGRVQLRIKNLLIKNTNANVFSAEFDLQRYERL